MLKIIQLTDLHIFTDPQAEMHGINTRHSFNAVLEHIRQQNDWPDMMLLTGDLIQDDLPSSYDVLSRQLSNIPVPIYWLAGNHDIDTLYQHKFEGTNIYNDKIIDNNNWRIILLDSRIPGEIPGSLNKQELQKLTTALKDAEEKGLFSFLAFHHPAIDTADERLKSMLLQNTDEFWSTIEPYQSVKGVVWGHVHQEMNIEKQGVQAWATPSTCSQFAPNVTEFTLDNKMPGYRRITCYDDGSINTTVERIESL